MQKFVERRHTKDRRSKPTQPLSRYAFIGGRRKEARRSGELDNYYVDRYESHLLIFISLILTFCVLDTIFSLKIQELGISEWNIFMAIFMKKNLGLSLVLKLLITIVCAIFLLLHKNFKLFGLVKTYLFIYIIFSIYFLLVLFEFYTLVHLGWV